METSESHGSRVDLDRIEQLAKAATPRAGRALAKENDTATAPTPRCDGCRYWAEVVKRDLDDNERHPDDFWGECRRYPPRRGAPYDAQFTYAPDEFEFPAVPAREWCGEFRAKP